nr:hypothetical protein [Tanacetum cinerariifolium]
SDGRINGKGKIKDGMLDFEDVYYVEELKHYNLFSVSQMCDKKNKVLFTDTDCLVLSPGFKLPDENQVLLKIPRQHNMYSFNVKNIDPYGDLSCLFAKASIDESNKWHRRLGHVNFKNINKLIKGNLVRGLPSKILENDHNCVACQKGKQHKASCKAKTDETTPILKDFIRQDENQFNHKVKTIRSNNGTEFKNHDLIELCGLKGIKREYSNAKTSQQNIVAKRKNRTLIEAARSMLADSFLPTTFWAEEVNTACYVLNRILATKPQNKTPYELLTGRQPIISYLRPFGCHVTILNTINQLGKFDGKGIDLHDEHFVLPIWSAYSTTVKSSKDKIQKTTDCKTCEKPVSQVEQIFQEELEKLKRQEKEANDAVRKEATQDANTNITNLLNAVSAPVSVVGPSRALNDDEPSYPDDLSMPHLKDIYASPSEGIFTNSSYDDEGVVTDFNNLETTVNVSPTPTTRIHTINPKTQILGDPMSAVQTRSKVKKNSEAHALISQALEDESWVDAMQEELLQFQIQKVWILVDSPFGKKAIGTKWVYRNKKDERGVVVRNKARLVSQGHRQEEGIYYDEVFSPVARFEAISIFLAFASYMGFIVYQMDVKSAFLYGTIDEEVYVTQPPDFVDPKFPNKVYKVVNALYGLHQAPRAWYATLSTFLKRSGYKRGAIDNTLYIKQDKKDIMLVHVYVDDITFSSTKKSRCDEFNELMKNRFQMSSMGELTFFLGLQVKQRKMTASTPIETQKPLVKDEEAADLNVTPKTSHLQAVKMIFRYLKGQPKLGLWYPKASSFNMEAYSDSDYVGVNLDRKSTIGGCQFLGRRLISWQCKKQTIVATSTSEAKYVDGAHCSTLVKGRLLEVTTAKQSKELASPKQMALGKDESNSLIVDSLLKTIWSSMHHVIAMKHWLFQSKRLLGSSPIDAKRVNIKESSIRRTLKLYDEEGISCLANDEIFTGLANMGALVLKPPPEMNLAALWHQQSSVMPQTKGLTSQVDHQLWDMSHHQDIYDNPSLTKKVFANIKRVDTSFSRVITPLFENMLVPAAEEVDCPTKFWILESEIIDIKSSFTHKIEKLEDRVHKLEEENRIFKEKSFKSTAPVEDKEESFKQERMIEDMNEDVEVNLEEAQAKAYNLDLQHSEKVFSIHDINKEEPAEVEEVLEVVKATKLFTKVVTTAKPTTTTATQVPQKSAPRKRKGVVIQDPKETAASVLVHTEVQPKDKGKGILIEEPKPLKRQAQIKKNNKVMRYQALKRKPLTEAQARKNMMIYLKNMAGFKMNFFKGMTYSEIRHLFEKHYNSNQAFLERVEEEVTVQEKEIEEEGNKRQEATPLASKVPVVNYQIHHKNNKPYYKIIRANETHKLFLSFITLLKNFNREALETFWKLVKEMFETTELKDFSDDFLLNILKIMFEKPNIEANVWKDKNGRYGLAKKYPLTHFTLEQMLNNVKLDVEEESEMSLELLMLVRRQLNEGINRLQLITAALHT